MKTTTKNEPMTVNVSQEALVLIWERAREIAHPWVPFYPRDNERSLTEGLERQQRLADEILKLTYEHRLVPSPEPGVSMRAQCGMPEREAS
jgi:hypothetical protein